MSSAIQKSKRPGRREAALDAFSAAWSDLGAGNDAATALRRAGFEAFTGTGLPTTRDEAWKYTSLRKLARHAFRPAGPAEAPSPKQVAAVSVDGLDAACIVFLNGRLEPGLSDLTNMDGIIARPMASYLDDHESSDAHPIGTVAAIGQHPFVALNQAFLRDGIVIRTVPGRAHDRSVYLLFLSVPGGEPVAAHPRVFVDATDGSQLTVVEHYVGFGNTANLTNAVTEISLGPAARVDHYRLQEETANTFHIGGLHAKLLRDAQLATHNVHLGGTLARLDIGIHLLDSGAETVMNGLYCVDGRRHVDNQTRVDHFAPHTLSNEVYRGIVGDHGRAVFNGKAIVHPDAQKIEAHQSNDNLLLSPEAEIDTKPELEIYADDVKCSHGATVGQLDADALFYLLSRGIAPDIAHDLLTFAFAEIVAKRMPLAAFRRRLERHLAGVLADDRLIQENLGAER
ncbi:MAG: Fe-S cluster assembly protein SufD [Gammaproteobacteria bacterium]|nr:MAG: Fe-S cluster assembly protein SufD [Gammaproteobacteria bacterium]